MVERPDGSVLAGLVRIEEKDDLLDVALQYPRVVSRERGPLRRDHVLHSRHKTRNQIKLPLANHCRLRLQQRPLRFIQPEKNLALGKNWGLGRVDVLGGFFVPRQHAATEANHAALLVGNCKDQSSTEPVIIMVALLLAQDQTGFLDQRWLISLMLGPVDPVVPKIGRVAETQNLPRLVRHGPPAPLTAPDF